jgi:predicted acetyltransferase
LTKYLRHIGSGGVYCLVLKPAQSTLYRHRGYEHSSRQSFMTYVTAKNLV